MGAGGGDLPASGKPIIRSRAFYDIDEPLGLDYTYTYNPVYYDDATPFAQALFGYLAGEAAAAPVEPLTLFQEDYNAQQNNTVDVTNNAWIEANKTEKWLIDNAPAAIDTTMPTIFFVNWWGQPGFKFHVYTKTNEPDPDTNYNFGVNRHSRKIVAWGGTTVNDEEDGLGAARGVNRIWFYDLSAGPESWGGSCNVDDADIDGDAIADYRIPVIWEYGHYRPASALAGDLGKVVRYVGLDLLFTSSPLYPPYFTADRIPNTVDLDSNTVEGWNKVDGSETYITPGLFESEVAELPAGISFSASYTDHEFKGDIKNCWLQWVQDNRCHNDHVQYPPFANLFLDWALNTSRFLDGNADYEAGLINYSVGIKPQNPGFLGYADDNWIDGTQSAIFSFVYPDVVVAGYGLTTTMIHEYGHHSSMSHPHDGYDLGTGADFGPGGETFFAWLGDESASIMSYIDLNWDFSQFDHDNSARHHAAGYIQIANRIAGQIPAGNAAAQAQLALADTEVGLAKLALAAHDYAGTLAHARLAYGHVRAAATIAGTAVSIRQPSTWTVSPEARAASA